ncbi:Uncharacterized protein dnl_54110 [Desulfonema limicola]|uniref:Uncharacterized protein n=1 Tax=Desulfonema limicola TaxID=45656 RepID=A0A975BCV2_9BACT|nr:Uncharacterized protein dnl_54110 [Desulfonema limicola]
MADSIFKWLPNLVCSFYAQYFLTESFLYSLICHSEFNILPVKKFCAFSYIFRLFHMPAMNGNRFERRLRNRLNQKHIAKECMDCIVDFVSFRAQKRRYCLFPML